MKKPIFIQVVAAAFAMLGLSANLSAENLPKSGIISINSIFKGDAPIKFNDAYSHYTSTGVTFNETGVGFCTWAKSHAPTVILRIRKSIKAPDFVPLKIKMATVFLFSMPVRVMRKVK